MQFPSIGKLKTIHSGSSAFWGVAFLEGQKLHFKAVPKELSREVRLTPWLQQFSTHTPIVLAAEPTLGWLLTQSAGDTPLIRDANPEHWLKALHAMSELQIATLAQHQVVLRLGCEILEPSKALTQARVILESSTDENAPRALATLSQFQLEGLDLLPLALNHGDFHPMNVISPSTIIDWSDALITHPFVDLERFLRWIMGNAKPHHWSPFSNTRELEPRFIRAYLEPWAGFAPIEKLEQTFKATRPFGMAVLLANARANAFLGRSLEAFYIRQLAKFVF
ncbi:MAG: hypothetical protein RLZZ156_1339 [Deinococcota bacterium]|jgi:hypothetical protein